MNQTVNDSNFDAGSGNGAAYVMLPIQTPSVYTNNFLIVRKDVLEAAQKMKEATSQEYCENDFWG